MSVNSGPKATQMIGRRRIPEFSRGRKETVDIDTFATSGNGDRKIIQSIRITSRTPTTNCKWNQFSQF